MVILFYSIDFSTIYLSVWMSILTPSNSYPIKSSNETAPCREGLCKYTIHATSLKYRSGNEDCVQCTYVVMYCTSSVFVSLLGGTSSSHILLYCDKVE